MAIAQHNSTINAKRFAALFAGFDTGNDSEEEAMAKVRVMRRMAEEAGLRIIDVLELPEVRQAIDEQLNPKRSESPDLAVAEERISELENELSERMSDVRKLADRLAQQQPIIDNTGDREPFVETNPFVRNDAEPLSPSLTGSQQGAANQHTSQSNATSGWNGTAQLSALHTVFWSVFAAVVFCYCCASWSIARPLATLDDFNQVAWWAYLLPVFLGAGIIYFGMDFNDLGWPEADTVRAFLIRPRVMLASIAGLIVAWSLLYSAWAQVMDKPLTEGARIVGMAIIVFGWWLLSGRRHWQNFGGRGVVLNALLCVGLAYPCLVVPLEISSSTSTMIKSVLAYAVFGFVFCSNWLANWIFENDSRFRGFAIVGAFFTLMTVVMIHEDTKTHPAKAPSHTATAPAPPHSKLNFQKSEKRRKAHKMPTMEDFK